MTATAGTAPPAATVVPGGGRDAVAAADRLRRRVADEITALVGGPAAAAGGGDGLDEPREARGRHEGGKAGESVGRDAGAADIAAPGAAGQATGGGGRDAVGGGSGRVHVSWVGALDVAACPARFRGQGEAGWGFPGWAPATAAGAVARAALQVYLDTAGRPGGGPPGLPAPLEIVRAWIRDARDLAGDGVAGWIAERRDARDAAALAATAAGAGRWLAGFLRVLGWPLPDGFGLLNSGHGTVTWRAPGLPAVSVGAGADARLGRVSGAGQFTLVVHRPSAGDDAGLHRRACFEAAAGALVRGIAPRSVLLTAGDTGERLRVDVDAGVLAAGAELIVDVVRHRVAAAHRGFDPVDATPSGQCRHCDSAPGCETGQVWLAGPGRSRGGLPVSG